MRVLPSGSRGVLVEVDDLAAVLALHAALQARSLPGVVDLVPAARTVLLVLDPAVTDPASVGEAVRALAPPGGPGPRTRWPAGGAEGGPGTAAEEDVETVTVPVVYDGEDLAEVGDLTGWGADGVVRHHTGTTWTVAFSGFAPGFAYCVAGRTGATGADRAGAVPGAEGHGPDSPDAWRVPRRQEPRTRVPAGSVALADGFTGVYPTASPGGWQLLGRTTAAVWDLDRDPPALLRPGVRVRFVEVPE